MTIFAIPPNRDDKILEENGNTTFRFARFLENIAEILRNLSNQEINTQDENYTFVSDDAGKIIRNTTSTVNQRYTIPSNADVDYPLGTFINIQNDSLLSLSIRIDTDTLTSSAGLGSGNRVLGPSGEAKIVKVDATTWKITGAQLT